MKTRSLLLGACLLATAVSAQRIVIRAGTLIDGQHPAQKNMQIVVEGSKIVSVGPTKNGGGAPTYERAKLTVMPGWIATHVHIGAHFAANGKATMGGPATAYSTLAGAANLWSTLQGGFTTVQSLGAPTDKDLREAVAAGQIPGPRLLTSIRQINETTGGGDLEKLRAYVRQAASEGA